MRKGGNTIRKEGPFAQSTRKEGGSPFAQCDNLVWENN